MSRLSLNPDPELNRTSLNREIQQGFYALVFRLNLIFSLLRKKNSFLPINIWTAISNLKGLLFLKKRARRLWLQVPVQLPVLPDHSVRR